MTPGISLQISQSLCLIVWGFHLWALYVSFVSWKPGIVLRLKDFLPFPIDMFISLDFKRNSETSASPYQSLLVCGISKCPDSTAFCS